jgi:hypothetical protein
MFEWTVKNSSWMGSQIRTLMPKPWISGEHLERGVNLGFNAIGNLCTRSLVEVSPNLKDVFVCLGRDDIPAHVRGLWASIQVAFFC